MGVRYKSCIWSESDYTSRFPNSTRHSQAAWLASRQLFTRQKLLSSFYHAVHFRAKLLRPYGLQGLEFTA